MLRCLLVVLLLGSASAYVNAWSDHASLLWPVVRHLPSLEARTVSAEPLEAFVTSESQGIADALAAHEAWTRAQGWDYALTPDTVRFPTNTAATREDFLRAIRVNPRLPYGLHRQQQLEESPLSTAVTLSWRDVSFLEPGVSTESLVYRSLAPGESVAVAHVLASANDEPDFGMDIGLFENNGTAFGARYGFGLQPFGNPNLSYGSQAPFHMGFYHLDWLTRLAQPDLQRTFPVWRIALYDRLAELAFATGHDYWGWRFMGWALHYIGDLTQPYHAVPLPGVSTLDALWLVAKGETAAAVQRVSNRHGVVESYQYQRLVSALRAEPGASTWLDVLQAGAQPSKPLIPDAIISDLAATSVAHAADLDLALETYAPPLFVSDPAFEWVGSGHETDVVTAVSAYGGPTSISALDRAIQVPLAELAMMARAWVLRALAHSGE